MRDVIDDPAVDVVPAWGSRPAAPPSGLNTEMFLALERVQKRLFPEAVTLPAMTTGTTDSAQLRAKGVHAKASGPLAARELMATMSASPSRASAPWWSFSTMRS